MSTTESIYTQAFKRGLKPRDNLSISEWADRYREIPKKAGSEPGRWRTDRTPYLREIMDKLSPQDPTQKVIVVKGTQLGFTEAGNNTIGYYIHQEPCPIGLWMPTEKLAEKHSKKKLEPTIEATTVLKELIAPKRSRDGSSTISEKSFPGGSLSISGSNSSSSFRSDSYRVILLDDVDGFIEDVEGEGSPIELAINRTDSFGAKRKIYINSTPTIKDLSHIETEFKDSDQREYFVPCPECGFFQTLEWSYVKFEHKDTQVVGDVTYQCMECGSLIPEYKKSDMLLGGKWVPQNQGHKNAGYKLNSLYSPLGWRSWGDIAEEFLKANKKAKGGDKRLLKRWINTRLAEAYEESGEVIEWQLIASRREEYKVPSEILVITAAVDTQKDRLEIDFKGWGEDEESFGLGLKIVRGRPDLAKVWQECDEILKTKFIRDDGIELKAEIALIDSGGHFANEVYNFTVSKEHRRVFAIKGSSTIGSPIVGRSSKVGKVKATLFFIGTDSAKSIIYDRLKLDEYGAGYMHFNSEYDEEYFKQLTSEKLIIKKDKKGASKQVWVKKRARNEALDLNVYQLAALKLLNPDFNALKNRQHVKPKPKEQEKNSNFISNWRDEL